MSRAIRVIVGDGITSLPPVVDTTFADALTLSDAATVNIAGSTGAQAVVDAEALTDSVALLSSGPQSRSRTDPLGLTDTVTVGGTIPPGLVPGQVLLGFYTAPDSVNNDYDHGRTLMYYGSENWWGTTDAVTIPGTHPKRKNPHAFKQFDTGWISVSRFQGNLADADRDGYYLYQTTKIPNGDWKGMAQGLYDTELAAFYPMFNQRLANGQRACAFGFHHEPHNDYNGTTRTAAWWAAMHIHNSWFYAGWRKSSDHTKGALPTDADAVHIPSLDIRAIVSVCCDNNGFMFTGSPSMLTELETLNPPDLISAFNANGGMVCADIYHSDTDPTGKKVRAFASWLRSHGVKDGGVPEIGGPNSTVMADAWAALKANVDLLHFAVWWDSGIGQPTPGATDWRLVPNNYPPDPVSAATLKKNPPFIGPGTAVTDGLLNQWRTILADSETMG